jgi:hypothetical protein
MRWTCWELCCSFNFLSKFVDSAHQSDRTSWTFVGRIWSFWDELGVLVWDILIQHLTPVETLFFDGWTCKINRKQSGGCWTMTPAHSTTRFPTHPMTTQGRAWWFGWTLAKLSLVSLSLSMLANLPCDPSIEPGFSKQMWGMKIIKGLQ